ncbi:MAG: hypothetical protein JXB49_22565 [Bacteroidales bacterium]|nr:hypothetical protein [Bacteroidales bacterium]
MKPLLLIAFATLTLHMSAQYSNISYDELETVLTSKTYIVLFGEKDFNEKLKESVKKYWTITEYEFINLEDVDNFIQHEGYNMLVPIVKGGGELFYMYYALIPTGKKTVQSVSYSKWYAHMIIPTQERFVIRMDNIIQCMVNIIHINQEQQFQGGAIKMGKHYVSYYNQFASRLKEGKLYLDKEFLEKHIGDDRREVKAVYPYNFEIIDGDRLKEIIDNKEENAYYCVVDGNQTTIFEVVTGDIIYCNVEMTPVFEIDKNILKDITEKIKQ